MTQTVLKIASLCIGLLLEELWGSFVNQSHYTQTVCATSVTLSSARHRLPQP